MFVEYYMVTLYPWSIVRSLFLKWVQQDRPMNDQINSPDYYKQAQSEINETLAELNSVTHNLEQAYKRWDLLDGS